MKVQVIGKRVLDFTDDKGNHINGTQVFLSYPSMDFEGVQVDKVFLAHNVINPGSLMVGGSYQAEYNRSGKLISFSAIK
uniref:Uncharacterized protein n=1 Tax=Dulem virus 75 TaxID=3145786 RepID=A0AAU8AUG6_9VIRU